jgi:hypothetical protein
VKPTPVIAIAAAVVALVALLWRQAALHGELAELQRALNEVRAGSPGSLAVERGGPSPGAAGPASAETSSSQEQQRIAELERVANAHADWIEELLRRLNESERSRQKSLAPGWSVLQAIGPPDTMTDGDQQTAWAPAQQDADMEWLVTEFERPVEAAQVIVRETCGPGCITKITSVTDEGVEVTLWAGEPPKNASPSNTAFAVPPGTTTRRIKVYLETKRVPGWNEIDAVELVGRDGSRQWAGNASASSSYGVGSRLYLGVDTFSLEPSTPNVIHGLDLTRRVETLR